MDNIGKRILHVLAEKKAKPTPFETVNEISRGYLNRAAKKGTGIGSEIVEKILLEYPDVDAFWLMTGQKQTVNNEESDKKHTAATNLNEAAAIGLKADLVKDQMERTIEILRVENLKLLEIVRILSERGPPD